MNSDHLMEYNALDAACTLECRNQFWEDVYPEFGPAYDMTIDLFPVLMFMQTRGIKVNRPALKETQAEVLKVAAEKQEELNKLCGRVLNVNSPKDCQTYFYVELGIPPYYNEGAVTVDDLALQRLVRGTAKRAGLRQAKLVQDIRGLLKLNGTYLSLEFDDDDRMRCSYNPRGTRFGRLSSSKTIFGTGTNTQNLAPEFKRFLEADGIFLEIDKRQAEWVVVAYLAGDANMIKAIEEGLDVHLHTAGLMFGVEPDILALESKLVGMNSDPDLISSIRAGESLLIDRCSGLPRTMSGRQCGKKSNHALNYDEGFAKFALLNEIEQREAKRIVELYHEIYPGIRQTFHEGVRRTLQKDRALVNCFGRKVRFLDAWGPDLWKAAYAMLPQSTVVDSLNQGMVQIYHDTDICGSQGANASIAAQVHDSILLDIPVDAIMQPNFEGLLQRMFDYVTPTLRYNGRYFSIATDFKIGRNWGGMSKTNPLGMREVKGVHSLAQALGELIGTGATGLDQCVSTIHGEQ